MRRTSQFFNLAPHFRSSHGESTVLQNGQGFCQTQLTQGYVFCWVCRSPSKSWNNSLQQQVAGWFHFWSLGSLSTQIHLLSIDGTCLGMSCSVVLGADQYHTVQETATEIKSRVIFNHSFLQALIKTYCTAIVVLWRSLRLTQFVLALIYSTRDTEG